jgi:hypothetical protein
MASKEREGGEWKMEMGTWDIAWDMAEGMGLVVGFCRDGSCRIMDR